MAESLIDLIKILRDRTGAGLMDCKSALLNNNSDLEKATDWLREKGLAKAAKKAGRVAAEGLAITKTCEKCGKTVILEVNCETDFVSKGEAFHAFVDAIAETILTNNCQDVESAKALCEGLFTDATVKMGEKFDLRRFVIIDKVDGQGVTTYIHMGGKIATVVVLAKEDAELGKGLAMHVAANNPQYLDIKDVPAAEFNHEKSVQLETAKNDEKLANKPAEMLAKIIDAKVTKYFSEMVLGSQAYLMDDSKTVANVLKEKNNSVIKFVRYQVGEGIEKRQDDFASEVMSQMK